MIGLGSPGPRSSHHLILNLGCVPEVEGGPCCPLTRRLGAPVPIHRDMKTIPARSITPDWFFSKVKSYSYHMTRKDVKVCVGHEVSNLLPYCENKSCPDTVCQPRWRQPLCQRSNSDGDDTWCYDGFINCCNRIRQVAR